MSAVINQPDISLCPMRIADLERIMEIETTMYAYPWTEGIFRDCLRVGYCCWVLKHEQRIIAYGVMSTGAGEAHVLNICVEKAYQRNGYAETLLKHLIELAGRHGADICLLEVRPSNRSAIGLYHKLGFNEVGIRRNYYPDQNGREDAMILALNLGFD
jgi:ribosomal-protein-alanine N-acetyltransferase